MYRRFLNNNDYLSIITTDALNQLTRGREECFAQAEEAAEASIVEYLTDNYEIERELEIGKRLVPYNNQITYPVGAHFYLDDKIVEAIRSINGLKAPSDKEYWEEIVNCDDRRIENATIYSQLLNYKPGDVVKFINTYYECIEFNGMDYQDIRIPGIKAWELLETYEWQPNLEYEEWSVVKWNDKFYALLNKEDIDLTVNPDDSDNWGLIGDYVTDYAYEFKETEYIVYNNNVYFPVMSPIADTLELGYNIRIHDPRNPNIKKHLVRLSLYELHKLISPNNISSARITDFEASMVWLHDANRCKINPQIPRKLDCEKKPVSEIAIATFMRDYDPYKNPWQI